MGFQSQRAGEEYDAFRPEFYEKLTETRELLWEFNSLRPSQLEEQRRIIRRLLGSCGEKFVINQPFRCDYGCNITIGHGFYANTDCIILDVAPVTIGDNVFFGPRVGLYTPYHPIDAQTRNAQLEGGLPIRIGNDVWFGANVTVCPGVTIGNDVVIGAGSVVTKDIPDHSVAVGNPARVIRAIDDAERDRWRAKAAEYRAWKGM